MNKHAYRVARFNDIKSNTQKADSMGIVSRKEAAIGGRLYVLTIETDTTAGCYSVFASHPISGRRERIGLIGVVRANGQTCHTVKTSQGAFPRFDGMAGCMVFLIDHLTQFSRHDRDIFVRMTIGND